MNFENKSFRNNTEHNFMQCVESGKKLILFGAGAEMKKAMELLIEPYSLKAAYVADNDFRKWYSRYCGIEIKEPACLEKEDAEEIVVLITSMYPYRIEKQLNRMGIKYYYSSLLFIEEHMGKQNFIFMF